MIVNDNGPKEQVASQCSRALFRHHMSILDIYFGHSLFSLSSLFYFLLILMTMCLHFHVSLSTLPTGVKDHSEHLLFCFDYQAGRFSVR